jgi:hypothetical protein
MKKLYFIFLFLFLCNGVDCLAQELYFVSDRKCKVEVIYNGKVYFTFKINKNEEKWIGLLPNEVANGVEFYIKDKRLFRRAKKITLKPSIEPFLFIIRDKKGYYYHWQSTSQFYTR